MGVQRRCEALVIFSHVSQLDIVGGVRPRFAQLYMMGFGHAVPREQRVVKPNRIDRSSMDGRIPQLGRNK